jgi:glycogen synthase
MIRTAMRQDYSWDRSAAVYEQAYIQAIANKQTAD